MHWGSWWLSPTWLHQEINPSKIHIETSLDTTEDSSPLQTQCYLIQKNQDPDFLTKFSSYIKLLGITACIQRFVHNARTSPKLTGPLKATELNNVCKVIKTIQNSVFEPD